MEHFNPETAGQKDGNKGSQYTEGDRKLERELNEWDGSDGESSDGGLRAV